MGVGIFLSVAYLLCDGMIMSFSDDFMWWIFFFFNFYLYLSRSGVLLFLVDFAFPFFLVMCESMDL